MASNEKYFTDRSYLIQDKVQADRLILDGKEYFQAVYNGKKVFNRALYSIEAFDMLIPAEGSPNMKGACMVDSFKTDFDGTESFVDYTISPESIDANNSSSEITGFYTVTQIGSGLQTTAWYTQGARVLIGYEYIGLKVTSVVYMFAPASGGYITPVVGYSGTRRAVYSNGDKVDEPWGSNTSLLLSAYGKPLVDGASFDTVGDYIGGVYAPDLGTTESDIRAVAEITSLTIEAIDGSILSWNGSAYAYQMENIKETQYSSPDIAVSYTDIGAGGTAAILTVKWTQVRTESYSSGAGPVVTSLSGTIDKSAISGNRITSISGTSYLSGTSLVTASGTASRGNITASSLEYTEKIRTKAYVVSVTVDINGKSASESVTVYQEANVVSSYYTEPQITSVKAGDVGAGGSAASISVVYTQSLVTKSTAVPKGKSKEVGGASVPSAVFGESVSNNGKTSGVNIVADSLGTNKMARSVVFQIHSVNVLANKETGIWTEKVDVWQQANEVVSTKYGAYSTSIYPSATTMVSDGGDVAITVACTRAVVYTYTSGSTQDSSVNATSALTTNIGKLSVSSIVGYGTSVLAIPENIGDALDVIVTASDPDGNKKQVTIRQDAVRYEFYTMMLAAIGSAGGDLSLTITSTRNGKDLPIYKSDVSVSGLSGVTVTGVTPIGHGEYQITVNVPENTSTNQRSFQISVTHPDEKMDTITWDAVQSGASQIKGKVSVVCHAEFTDNAYGNVSYRIAFDASNETYYSGGTISNVYITLNTKIDGSGTVIAQQKLYDSLQVQRGTSSETKLGTLVNNSGSSLIYVLVYYDNMLQYKSVPMMSPDLNI